MKTVFRSFLPVALLLGWMETTGVSFGQAPVGSITNIVLNTTNANNVVNATNALWDMSLLEGLQALTVSGFINGKAATNYYWQLLDGPEKVAEPMPTNGSALVISANTPFLQNGRGRFVGKGTNTMNVTLQTAYWTGNIFSPWDWTNTIEVPAFDGSYVLSGSMMGVQGTVLVQMRVQTSGQSLLAGKLHRVSATRAITFLKRSTEYGIRTSTGDRIAVDGKRALLSPGGQQEPLEHYMGDGTWTLVLNFDPVSSTAPTRLTGSATVTLNSGAIYPFQFSGRYSPKTGLSTVLLKGTNDSTGTADARGATLTVTVANGQVTRMLGRIAGQAINQK